MLELIKGMLAPRSSAESDERTEKERIQLATCVLLLEMAHADSEFHEMESALIQHLLQKKFDLSFEAASELMEFAQLERQSSLDLYQFTKRINHNFSIKEKLEMMEALWRIVYADGVLDRYEDYLVRQMATLLRLGHRKMIEAKLKVLEEMRSGVRSSDSKDL
jgi:uncharacterized tellurite resistance protein B-like protein